jgi:RNA polymerase sigma-70 factor (ECF subfamily)
VDDDIQVIKRVQRGDTDAFAILVERYHRRLLNFIWGMVGDAALVEDLGQDVFLNVFRKLPEFRCNCGVPFAAWLFIAARNRCITHLRTSRVRCFVGLDAVEELSSESRSAEDVLLVRERRNALRKAMEILPDPFKSTLQQSLKGHSLEEISMAQGLPSGTVKSRLFRARERIKVILEKLLQGDLRERV